MPLEVPCSCQMRNSVSNAMSRSLFSTWHFGSVDFGKHSGTSHSITCLAIHTYTLLWAGPIIHTRPNTPSQDGWYISIIPILLHARLHSFTPKPFVKQSATWLHEFTWLNSSIPSSIFSSMKKWFISTCLVLSRWTRLLAMLIADLLSAPNPQGAFS